MSDLISKAAVIEAIHESLYPYVYGGEDGDPVSDFEDAIFTINKAICTAVRALPSAQPEQCWIPCSERFPDVNKDGESDYIMLNFSNYSLPIIGRYQVDDAFYNGDDDKPLVSYGLFVNAWMPLPEPYNPDDFSQHMNPPIEV